MTNRFLKIGFILLVLMNLSLLFFLLGKGEINKGLRDFEGPREGSPVERLSADLGFSAEQKDALHQLFESHKAAMDEIFLQQRGAKDALFDQISKEESSKDEELLNNIAKIELAKDQQTLKHMREIRALCNEKQLEIYTTVIKRLLHKEKGQRRKAPAMR
jgi:hypothetical protein